MRARPEHADRVLAELLELVPGGVEEERGETYVEFAIYGAPGELPAVPDLEAATGEGTVEISSAEVPDGWADRWRDLHGPVVVGGAVRVRPSWVEPDAERRGDLVDIVIDPARAFGTGAHATTRLCIELLLELARSGGARGALADWGTGSGILAIAAAKLGFSPVVACDHEPAAVEAAEANAAANEMEVEVARVNLREQAPPVAPTVTANLTVPVLTAVAARLTGRVTEVPRTLICSGLLAGEVDDVGAAFAPAGLRERTRRSDGDWHAVLLAS